MNENIIRSTSHYLLEFLSKYSNKVIGYYYTTIHCIIMVFCGFIICFNTNIVQLGCTLLVISLDAFSIVVLHGCPLTTLERNYLQTDTSKERRDYFKKCGIVYQCDHEYEKQIELLVNVWSLLALKCLFLIVFKTFATLRYLPDLNV